jgi:hypothetical protein
MPNTSFADVMAEWDKLIATTDINKTDLPYLAEIRSQLITVRDGAKEANLRQSAFKAQFQQSTRDLEEFLEKGRDLSTRLRNGVRTQYGLKGEKLTEFGLQPRRKPQKAKAEPTVPPAPPSDNSDGLTPEK